jgi:Sigma-70 factor, region 1.1
LHSEDVNSEQIEDVLAMFSEMGVHVVETEEASEEGEEAREEADEEGEGESESESGSDYIYIRDKTRYQNSVVFRRLVRQPRTPPLSHYCTKQRVQGQPSLLFSSPPLQS